MPRLSLTILELMTYIAVSTWHLAPYLLVCLHIPHAIELATSVLSLYDDFNGVDYFKAFTRDIGLVEDTEHHMFTNTPVVQR